MSIHQQKMIRYTLDMMPELHRHLKIVCAEDGVSLHDFVTLAIEEKFEAREEKLDALAFDEGMKDLASGKTYSLEDVQKELGL
jgi:hypothetical protein